MQFSKHKNTINYQQYKPVEYVLTISLCFGHCKPRFVIGEVTENNKWTFFGLCRKKICVPSAAVAVSRGGGCLLPGGVCSGGCLLRRGLLGGGGVCSGGGCLLLGGVCSLEGLLSGGCGIPACTEADTPTPPPRGQTDACKNITFATSLRTVKISTLTSFTH